MMNKVSMDKQYRTRAGVPVEIVKTDLMHQFPVLGIIHKPNEQIVVQFTEYGHFYFGDQQSLNDLVEVSEWGDFKIDEPVMVRDHPEEYSGELWQRRYFAGIVDGKPSAWAGGRTSWTTGCRTTWNKCRRPTPEELGQ